MLTLVLGFTLDCVYWEGHIEVISRQILCWVTTASIVQLPHSLRMSVTWEVLGLEGSPEKNE